MHTAEQFQQHLHGPYCARHHAHTDGDGSAHKIVVDLDLIAGCLATRRSGQQPRLHAGQGFVL
jgi:hypothetical protein